ncbi:molybdopterin molybdenumtransferase MoeA, partial [bacterium]|nr:molybdopterin molybdenumtransferase MoeA [bacterium]
MSQLPGMPLSSLQLWNRRIGDDVMRNNVSIEEAVTLLLDITKSVSPTLVPLWHAASRVLCEDILANRYVPPFDRSAMDGYAVRSADAETASLYHPLMLKVVDSSKAAVSPASCSKISTGDPIPHWADAVVQYEETQRSEDQIKIGRPLRPGSNVVPRGEDIQPGDLIARRGLIINAPLAAVFGGLGMNMIPVYRIVKVALLITGDDLVNPSKELPPGKVFNSNLYGLAARCQELGADPVNLGIVSDNAKIVASRISAGLELADIVVTTGGISVDESDVVVEALRKAGTELLFQRVAMKPGSPTLAATNHGKVIIGLSGNPAAAMISFEMIVVPLIKRLMGLQSV